jgi:hypothetical protein
MTNNTYTVIAEEGGWFNPDVELEIMALCARLGDTAKQADGEMPPGFRMHCLQDDDGVVVPSWYRIVIDELDVAVELARQFHRFNLNVSIAFGDDDGFHQRHPNESDGASYACREKKS